jgi:16S rRNA (uracil1498-N3)-methyltransferase
MADELTEAGGRTRLYVTGDLGEGVALALEEGQAHYLLHVLRAKNGDLVSLFNGRDGEWLAELATTKRGVTATCRKRTEVQHGGPDIWLAFAPVKKTPSDYLVQKAVELGVSVLQPVFTRRTIVGRINEERMAANAVEAAEQSGRLTVPEIRGGVTFDKLLESWPTERRLLFCDEGARKPWRPHRHPHRPRRRLRSGRTRGLAGAALRRAGDTGPAHPARRHRRAGRPVSLAGRRRRLELTRSRRARQSIARPPRCHMRVR